MLDTLTERDRLLVAAQAAGWALIVALLLVALWLGARIFWRLADAPQNPQPAGPAVTTAGSSNRPPADLAGLHLFGQSGLSAAPQTFDAPETSLDLVLVGTLAADSADAGMAIVADSEGDGFYQVGDALPGDAELHEVYADRIVLIHQGQFETLRLREEADTRSARPPRRTEGGPRGPAAPMPGIRGAPGQTGVNWAQVQHNLSLDPGELARQVRALPHMENGRQIGVRLQAGRDTLLFSKLGLRNTDIITSVNNIPLDNPGRAIELVNQLSSQSQFQVRLRRDGREMTLNIDANQLAR